MRVVRIKKSDVLKSWTFNNASVHIYEVKSEKLDMKKSDRKIEISKVSEKSKIFNLITISAKNTRT